VTSAGESLKTVADSGDLGLADVGGVVSTFGRCGVDGADSIILPGIFTIGGGGRPVLYGSRVGVIFLLVPGCVCWCDSCRDGDSIGFPAPPYFWSSSCVVLYLVAFLKSAIFASRCFCRASTCAYCCDILQSKFTVIPFLTV
jgi:hypothetical protein